MLASHSLLLLGVPLNRVLARIRAIREERYSLFRGFFHGATDAADAAENLQPRLHSVLLHRPRRGGRPHARARSSSTGWSRSPACGGAARASQRPDAGLALRGRRRRRAARPAGGSRDRRADACSRAERSAPQADRGSLRRRRSGPATIAASSCPRTPCSRRPRAAAVAAPRPPPLRARRRARRRDVRLRPPRARSCTGINMTHPARQGGRDHGRLGLRQDDDPAPDRRAAARRRPAACVVAGQSVPDLDRDGLFALRRRARDAVPVRRAVHRHDGVREHRVPAARAHRSARGR